MDLTNEERFDLLEAYFINGRSATRALVWYQNKYPQRDFPTIKRLQKMVNNLKQGGSFIKSKLIKPRICNEDLEIAILTYFESFPTNSTRNAADNIQVSQATICKVLKKYNYKCYRSGRIVQMLHPGDNIRRLDFCNWLKQKIDNDRHFLCNILFSDETNFSNNGMYNRKNKHYWSNTNPLRITEGHRQVRFSFNCWCGILKDRIFYFKIYDGTLTTFKYVEILNELFEELDNLPLAQTNQLFFQQDGAPAHNSRTVKEMLIQQFGENFIATHGPVPWPARSPDLTPLDYFLWGYVKNEIYKDTYNAIDDLKRSLENILNGINNIVMLNAVQSLKRRIQLCIENNGHHFEQLMS